MNRFIDYGIYGDGDIYESDFGIPSRFVANQEIHQHYVSVKFKYTAALTPGGTEALRIHNIVARVSPDRQGRSSYEAFLDRVQFTQRVSIALKHTGSEIILSHIQLIAQRKKHQPVG